MFHGAERTNKERVSQELAQCLGIPLLCFEKYTEDLNTPKGLLTFAEQLFYQQKRLDYFESLMMVNKDFNFVVDTTPFNILSILLSSVDSTTSVLFDETVENFITRCIELSRVLTDFITLQPNKIYISNNTNKTLSSMTFNTTVTQNIVGSLIRYSSELRNKKYILVPSDRVTLEEQVDFCLAVL